MSDYDYRGYKLISNDRQSRPRVDVWAHLPNRTMRLIATRTSLDEAMRFVDGKKGEEERA